MIFTIGEIIVDIFENEYFVRLSEQKNWIYRTQTIYY